MDISAAPEIKAVLVLGSNGRRIAVKYYEEDMKTDIAKQQSFESALYKKTSKTSARVDSEVIIFQKYVVLYQFISDTFFYVLARAGENELLISSVLSALTESISHLLRNQVDKYTVTSNLDLLLLAIDEIIDDGTILELDAGLIVQRVSMRGADDMQEQSLTQAIQSARDQFVRSFQ